MRRSLKLFIDTETTGLPKRRNAPYSDVGNWPRLVQIAWVLVDPAGREVSAVEYVIHPVGFSIPNEAAQIHGITTEIARAEGIPITRALTEFGEAVLIAETIIAHNVEYDRPVLEAEHIRHNLQCEIGSRRLLCTMKTSTGYCAIPGNYGYKWPTLNELHEKLFEKPMQEAHNALIDVRACIKCYFELGKRGVIDTQR